MSLETANILHSKKCQTSWYNNCGTQQETETVLSSKIRLTNTPNFHSRASKCPESRLSTRTRRFCLIPTSSPQLNVQSSNPQFLWKLRITKDISTHSYWDIKKSEIKVAKWKTLHLCATSCAASMAAYGDDSSLSALTFIPPASTKTSVL